MSRNSRSRHKKRRDGSTIARRSLPLFDSLPKPVTYVDLAKLESTFDPKDQLKDVDDYRNYHPSRIERPYRNTQGGKITTNKDNFAILRKPYKSDVKHIFYADKDALICVRRKIREEVLHALSKTGRRGQNRPKISWKSQIKCRRK